MEATPAETLAKVVSEAWPSSREPRPRAVEVDEVNPAIGNPVALVKTPADGVPISGVVRVIPAKVSAADDRFNATEVVPIKVEEELAALSPVLVPETETAPAPIVNTEVLPELAVSVKVPVLTVSAVVKVALVTEPEVKPEAVPVKLVATPEDGVPRAPPLKRTVPPVPKATLEASVPVNVKVLEMVATLPLATLAPRYELFQSAAAVGVVATAVKMAEVEAAKMVMVLAPED
jgi:hypothetical protein